jgi:hypothetical protein
VSIFAASQGRPCNVTVEVVATSRAADASHDCCRAMCMTNSQALNSDYVRKINTVGTSQ